MGRCRDHCPGGRHGSPWRLDLVLTLLLVGGGAWLVGRVAPVADAALSTAFGWLGWGLAAVVLVAVVSMVGIAWLNRRARARWAELERDAQVSREPSAPAALTESARQLDAVAVVRAEAFVERERDREVA